MVDEANSLNLSAYLKTLNHDRVIPPLEKWHPTYCGEMDLIIKANGEWWHEGQLIRRQKMIDLFSKILCKEGEDFYLKTPAEKIKIKVEDAPLLIVDIHKLEIEGLSYLQCTTQNQDIFFIDEDHSVFMRSYQGQVRPYVHVRAGLDALIQRQAFYHLVEYCELQQENQYTTLRLISGQAHFNLSIAME